ncbi:hypothetical protein [Arthrobacter sp. HLT1-20]
MQQAAEATERWEKLFAVATGDPVAALVIRLLGDGMLLNSITDDDSAPSVDSILRWLDRRPAK